MKEDTTGDWEKRAMDMCKANSFSTSQIDNIFYLVREEKIQSANRVVDFIIQKAPATEVPLVLLPGMKIHPVAPKTLEEARHLED